MSADPGACAPTIRLPALALAAALLAPALALPAEPLPAQHPRPPQLRPLDLPPAPAELPEPAPAPSDDPSAPLAPTAEGPAEARPSPRLLESPNGHFLDTWLDLPHAFLERRIFAIVNGFDRFFADERDLGTARSRSFIRWRNEVSVAEDGTLDFGTSVRADLTLPYIRKRLKRFRLLLENAGRGASDSEPRAISGQGDGGRADALLRLTLLETLRSSIDLGGGILFDLPPGVVGRVRFRRAQELGRFALARVVTTGFWNTVDGFGANGSLGLERSLGRPLLLRWTNGTLISQSSAGYESASELALLATLGRTSGITLLGSVSTESKPDLVIRRWRVATRLRTALYKRWIYGEVEPQVSWPLDDLGQRTRVPSILFRLEIQLDETASNSPVAAGPQCGQASAQGCPRGGA